MYAASRTDSEIQQDVLRELRWDVIARETDVGIQVSHGVVTLSGVVDSWAKRVAAIEAVHRVHGVRDVANELAVQRDRRLPRHPVFYVVR